MLTIARCPSGQQLLTIGASSPFAVRGCGRRQRWHVLSALVQDFIPFEPAQVLDVLPGFNHRGAAVQPPSETTPSPVERTAPTVEVRIADERVAPNAPGSVKVDEHDASTVVAIVEVR